jgi:hypothetical protein
MGHAHNQIYWIKGEQKEKGEEGRAIWGLQHGTKKSEKEEGRTRKEEGRIENV